MEFDKRQKESVRVYDMQIDVRGSRGDELICNGKIYQWHYQCALIGGHSGSNGFLDDASSASSCANVSYGRDDLSDDKVDTRIHQIDSDYKGCKAYSYWIGTSKGGDDDDSNDNVVDESLVFGSMA